MDINQPYYQISINYDSSIIIIYIPSTNIWKNKTCSNIWKNKTMFQRTNQSSISIWSISIHISTKHQPYINRIPTIVINHIQWLINSARGPTATGQRPSSACRAWRAALGAREKPWENPQKHGKIMGKPMGKWENYGKMGKSLKKTMGKPIDKWENQRKTIGKPIEAHRKMEV